MSEFVDSSRTDAKHEAILAAAVEMFLRLGYPGTRVDAVAKAAGVGRQAVNAHFGDKDELFVAAVERALATDRGLDHPIADTGDPRSDLTTAGLRLLRVAGTAEAAALHRLLVTELPHFRDLQRRWRDRRPKGFQSAVAAYLSVRDRDGQLYVPYPDRSARQFTFLVTAEAEDLSGYGTLPLTKAQRYTIAHDSADLVVRAHQR